MDRLRLADGRDLAYEEWGDPSGRPVVLLHGSPGSRRFRPDDVVTARAGVRLVTFDRPGYGGSDRRAGREVVDTAGDLLALADHLGLGRFAVVGWSGGGPHALVTAVARPERVAAVVLVASPGPLDEVPGAWDALGSYMEPTARAARVAPATAARAVDRHMTPFLGEPARFLGSGRGPDRAALTDPRWRPMLVEQVTEAVRAGTGGIADDLVALWRPWGTSPGDVAVPTVVLHGAHDTVAEPDARFLARTIPDARLVVWPDLGHFGVLERWAEVLASSV